MYWSMSMDLLPASMGPALAQRWMLTHRRASPVPFRRSNPWVPSKAHLSDYIIGESNMTPRSLLAFITAFLNDDANKNVSGLSPSKGRP